MATCTARARGTVPRLRLALSFAFQFPLPPLPGSQLLPNQEMALRSPGAQFRAERISFSRPQVWTAAFGPTSMALSWPAVQWRQHLIRVPQLATAFIELSCFRDDFDCRQTNEIGRSPASCFNRAA